MTAMQRLAIIDRGEPAMRCISAVAELNRESAGQITTIALSSGRHRVRRSQDSTRRTCSRYPAPVCCRGPVTVNRRASVAPDERARVLYADGRSEHVPHGLVASSFPDATSRCGLSGGVLGDLPERGHGDARPAQTGEVQEHGLGVLKLQELPAVIFHRLDPEDGPELAHRRVRSEERYVLGAWPEGSYPSGQCR